jgi:hypothetical protein
MGASTTLKVELVQYIVLHMFQIERRFVIPDRRILYSESSVRYCTIQDTPK